MFDRQIAKAVCQELGLHGTPMGMSLPRLSIEIIDISQCDRAWNFGPRQVRSDLLPAWALEGFLLNGFHLEQPHPVQNVTQLPRDSAVELLFSVHPDLTWPEVNRLIRRPGFADHFDVSLVLQKYKIKWDETCQNLSDWMLHWPAEIQEYISKKEIKAHDLSILKDLESDTRRDLLTLICQARPSKSAFCYTLEMAGELILMGTPVAEVISILKTSDPLPQLRKRRFANSLSMDEKMKEEMGQWSWPSQVGSQVQRKGDVRGIEVKFFAKDPKDLEKTIKGLQNVISDWKKWQDEFDQSL